MIKKRDIVPKVITQMVRATQDEESDEESRIIPYQETDSRVKVASCRLCNSKFRDEIEKQFRKQRIPNYNVIFQSLQDKGEDIAYHTIRTHLIYHFSYPGKKKLLFEYSKDIQKWLRIQPKKVASLRIKKAILEREMVLLAAEGQDASLDERRKNADTIKKLADSILNYETKLETHQRSLEPISIVFNELKIIITDELKDVRTNETKRVLVNVLEKLQEKVGDLEVNQLKLITTESKSL